MEWSNPKLWPILDGNAECQYNMECQSGVQSKTPSYFRFGVWIALQNSGVLKCPAFPPFPVGHLVHEHGWYLSLKLTAAHTAKFHELMISVFPHKIISDS